jgi:hypothetical protein
MEKVPALRRLCGKSQHFYIGVVIHENTVFTTEEK